MVIINIMRNIEASLPINQSHRIAVAISKTMDLNSRQNIKTLNCEISKLGETIQEQRAKLSEKDQKEEISRKRRWQTVS
jgi:hypothetical protein